MMTPAERSEALKAISAVLHEQFLALAALNDAYEDNIVGANMHLMDAIDRVDVAVASHLDRRVAA